MKLERFVVQSGNDIPATSTVCLLRDGQPARHTATGDGPIAASFQICQLPVAMGSLHSLAGLLSTENQIVFGSLL